MRVKGVSSSGTRLATTEESKTQGKVRTQRIGENGKSNLKKTSFIEELRESSDLRTKEILDEVLGSIDEAANLFLKHPTYGNLLTYKGLVQRFMKLVIERLYRVKERLGSKATTRQKIYTLIEEVDKRLALLTEEVLAGQSDPLNLMAKMDEIRGMLVDMYL